MGNSVRCNPSYCRLNKSLGEIKRDIFLCILLFPVIHLRKIKIICMKTLKLNWSSVVVSYKR